MRLFVNLNDSIVSARLEDRFPAVAPFTCKRGDASRVEIQFHRDGVPERLADGSLLTFILKALNNFDGAAIVECNVFPRPASDTGFYIGRPNFGEAALNTLLGHDGTPGNDVALVTLGAEVVWHEYPTLEENSSKSFSVTVENDYKKGTETTPTPVIPYSLAFLQHRYDLTTFTGGGAAALDGVDVSGMSVGQIIAMKATAEGVVSFWQLTAPLAISANTVANPTVITSAAHGLPAGITAIVIGGSNSTPTIDGARNATYIGVNTFSVTVNVTVAGTAGYFGPAENAAGGLVRPDTNAAGKYWTRLG